MAVFISRLGWSNDYATVLQTEIGMARQSVVAMEFSYSQRVWGGEGFESIGEAYLLLGASGTDVFLASHLISGTYILVWATCPPSKDLLWPTCPSIIHPLSHDVHNFAYLVTITVLSHKTDLESPFFYALPFCPLEFFLHL